VSETSREAELAHEIAETALRLGVQVAAAESITAGHVASALAAGTNGSEWFCGSIVAYQTPVKQALLGVTTDQVITAECAEQMARGALWATHADLVVATTGVGGPDPEEGRPPGTVFICAGNTEKLTVFEHAFDGDPEAVVVAATLQALQHLRDVAA
jgi:PncC family amidohydrolase